MPWKTPTWHASNGNQSTPRIITLSTTTAKEVGLGGLGVFKGKESTSMRKSRTKGIRKKEGIWAACKIKVWTKKSCACKFPSLPKAFFKVKRAHHIIMGLCASKSATKVASANISSAAQKPEIKSALKVATWNLAAINNNPFEYWTTTRGLTLWCPFY